MELAEEKGMKQPTAVAKELNLPEDNDHFSFDKWDEDLDGSLSPDEVFNTSQSIFILFQITISCLSSSRLFR